MTHMQTKQELALSIRKKIEEEYDLNQTRPDRSDLGYDAKITTEYQDSILFALSQKPSKEIYQGTVDPKVIARRRAKNKRARQSRIINRRTNKR